MQVILDAIQDSLANLKDNNKTIFKSVEIHGGGFNGIEDLETFSQNAPSARVGMASMGEIERNSSNQLECLCEFGVVFTAKDINAKQNRHAEALRMLEPLLLIIKNGRWGVETYFMYDTEPKSIKTTNYYGSSVRKIGVAMWKVSWVQKVVLGADRFKEFEHKMSK